MDYLTLRSTIISEIGGSYTNNSRWHPGLKTYTFDIFTGRMNETQKQHLKSLLDKADVNVLNMSGSRVVIMERLLTVCKQDMGKYHPTNKHRDQVEYAEPSLIRFIGHTAAGAPNRVIVLGGNFPNTSKHATIDISWDPIVISDWERWCLQANFPERNVVGQFETLVEYLVKPEDHPTWKPNV